MVKGYPIKALQIPRETRAEAFFRTRARYLVVAVGHSRSEAAVEFLLNLARATRGLQNLEDAWIELLGRLNVPTSREILLSTSTPKFPGSA